MKVNCSLKTGLRVFRWTFVSNFFFLSGSRNTFTYGSDVPPMSKAGSSAAWMIPTSSWNKQRIQQTQTLVGILEKIYLLTSLDIVIPPSSSLLLINIFLLWIWAQKANEVSCTDFRNPIMADAGSRKPGFKHKRGFQKVADYS